jgi:hypothetical protein
LPSWRNNSVPGLYAFCRHLTVWWGLLHVTLGLCVFIGLLLVAGM